MASSSAAKKSILKGDGTCVEPKLVHRLIEENMVKQNFQDDVAVIFEGEISGSGMHEPKILKLSVCFLQTTASQSNPSNTRP